jgi:hypothetical protein
MLPAEALAGGSFSGGGTSWVAIIALIVGVVALVAGGIALARVGGRQLA